MGLFLRQMLSARKRTAISIRLIGNVQYVTVYVPYRIVNFLGVFTKNVRIRGNKLKFHGITLLYIHIYIYIL